ncbi:MAG TPA: hypothetical protein VGG18_11400 [Granulicella sp.]|jgi:hypothetical protein
MDRRKSFVLSGLAGFVFLSASGCHSAYVEAVVRNDSGSAVSLVELDYPSAGFGTESLAAGAEYHYRFKILGNGPTKVIWTDSARREHTVTGPKLQEGLQGRLTVTLSATSATWNTELHR